MNMKKWTALLAALALVLCVLAGCGGSRALTSVLLDLLEGQYTNVQVETDPELERALRRAAADGGDTADILARLKNELNLTGGSLSLSRLGDGQQGERAVELRFETGDDPDAAARRVFVTWNGVFGGLPRDGQYAASIAMIEAENGYYIAVDVNVVKAGAQHDDSDDEPEEPYTKNTDGSYTINTPDGLGKLLDKIGKDAIATAHIKLESDVTLPASWPDDIAFSGILDGNGKTITIGGRTQGLFEEITSDNSKSRSGETTGTVKNLHVLVTGNISGNVYSGYAGAVAGVNKGEITNCHVTIETDGSIISADGTGTAYAGGVAGSNEEKITNCHVTIMNGSSISASASSVSISARAGGVAGGNSDNISGCTVTIESGGSISASGGEQTNHAGSVVGYNGSGTVTDNTVEDSNDPKLPEIGN